MKRLLFIAVVAGCSSSSEQPSPDAAIPDAAVDAAADWDVDGMRPMTSCPPGYVPDGTPCDYAGVCALNCGPCVPPLEVRCLDGRWTSTSCPPTDKTLCPGPCATDADCDVTGEAINKCSTSLPVPALPTPRCVSACSLGDVTKPTYCDGDMGLCSTALGDPLCLPLCQFRNDGAAPAGCEGLNACNFAAHGRDSTTGELIAIGYCLGGCKVDSDCPKPTVCQIETSWCVRTRATYTKSLGDACTSDIECACFKNASAGYCTRACRVGESCPTGYTCDPALPSEFTKLPTGLLGRCLKDCTTDAECVNSKCQQNGGLDHKTCTVLP
jgi:hypothetical protein